MKKMKSMLAALLAVLLLTGCGSTSAPAKTKPSTEPPATKSAETVREPETALPGPQEDLGDVSLRNLRRDMEPSAAIGGIFYLGCFDGEPMTDEFWTMLGGEGYLDQYPFMQYLDLGHYVQYEGCEVYCIVPADPNAHVMVYAWDELNFELGDLLYESYTGEPFLVQGNVSDIMPNLAITIEDSYGNFLENYSPRISNRDGMVMLPLPFEPLMLDFTIYYGDPTIFFDLYVPNENYDGFDILPAQAQFLDPDLVVQLLIEHRVLPDDVVLEDYFFDYESESLYVNFNEEFLNYVSDPDVSWETYTMVAITRSFISAFPDEIKAVNYSVYGEPLTTQNYCYDYPFYWGDL